MNNLGNTLNQRDLKSKLLMTMALSFYAPMFIASFFIWSFVKEKLDPAALNSMLTLLIVSGTLVVLIGGICSWFVVNKITQRMMNIAGSLHESSKNMNTDLKELQKESLTVSDSSVRQAAAIQQTVATLDQITAMINRSNEQAQDFSKNAKKNLENANQGQLVVKEMLAAMSQIDKSNQKIMSDVEQSNMEISQISKVISDISQKTSMINDIVFQTKLLSFNASVEAARAGEHGKGFAVVAEEVGKLAEMSGNAAKEIESLLSESSGQVDRIVNNTKASVSKSVETGKVNVEEGVAVANRCQDILVDIVGNAQNIESGISELVTATLEQSQGVSNIAAAMNDLDQVTQQNSTNAEKSVRLVSELFGQLNQVSENIQGLESEIIGGISSATFYSKKISQVSSIETKSKETKIQKVESAKIKNSPVKKSEQTKPALNLIKNAKVSKIINPQKVENKNKNKIVQLKSLKVSERMPEIKIEKIAVGSGGGLVPDKNDPRFEEV